MYRVQTINFINSKGGIDSIHRRDTWCQICQIVGLEGFFHCVEDFEGVLVGVGKKLATDGVVKPLDDSVVLASPGVYEIWANYLNCPCKINIHLVNMGI